ncbi:helix-hairpin-helix domain-containing protein [Salinirarus marinus]|uniref:helix-hairpin-helix domain-containing protein n=1 Tax=Salinirarus marinus TaxID=3068310 RepID=UPI003C6C785D
MGLLDKLKSMLTGGGSSTERERSDTTVRVERDVGEDADAVDEPVATETSASASTESLVDESAEGVEAAEPAEAAGPESEDVDTDVEIEEAEPGRHPDAAESVDVLKGIGPAYAERLGDADVYTVGDLRDADAAELAAATDLSETRVSRWIERANDY